VRRGFFRSWRSVWRWLWRRRAPSTRRRTPSLKEGRATDPGVARVRAARASRRRARLRHQARARARSRARTLARAVGMALGAARLGAPARAAIVSRGELAVRAERHPLVTAPSCIATANASTPTWMRLIAAAAANRVGPHGAARTENASARATARSALPAASIRRPIISIAGAATCLVRAPASA
jgi:hypothetical protein